MRTPLLATSPVTTQRREEGQASPSGVKLAGRSGRGMRSNEDDPGLSQASSGAVPLALNCAPMHPPVGLHASGVFRRSPCGRKPLSAPRIRCQRAPPSRVLRITPLMSRKQVASELHCSVASALSDPRTPAGVPWSIQVVPPSALVSTLSLRPASAGAAPYASSMQNDVATQASGPGTLVAARKVAST